MTQTITVPNSSFWMIKVTYTKLKHDSLTQSAAYSRIFPPVSALAWHFFVTWEEQFAGQRFVPFTLTAADISVCIQLPPLFPGNHEAERASETKRGRTSCSPSWKPGSRVRQEGTRDRVYLLEHVPVAYSIPPAPLPDNTIKRCIHRQINSLTGSNDAHPIISQW